MMNDKRKYLIFILILIAFVSIGGVSANTQDNTTSITNADVLDETVLIDDSLYDDQPTMLSNPTSDFNNTVEVDDNPQLSSQDDSSNCLLDNGSDYVVNSPIVNPDFEDGLNGWEGYGVSITNFALNSKSGTKFISLSTNGYFSQFINLDTIDSVSFWYMSNTKNATIDIHVDDISLDNYTIQKTGLGKKKWEEVKLDLSNFTGYHTLNITQSYGSGYIDYFNITYNSNIVANFTIESYEISDGKIRINFTDLSQGLISEYLWDFGDGNYSNKQNPNHIFKLDNLNITLTVLSSNSTSRHNFSLPITLPFIERTDNNFSTIQEAIDNAIEGDVIIIVPNVLTSNYFENLIVNKSITFNFINCTLNPKNNIIPLISVVDGASVVVNNISLGKSGNVFKTDNLSSLLIHNSHIRDSNLIFSEGNIALNNNQFFNTYLTLIESNTVISDCNVTNSSVIVNGGKSKISNNIFLECNVAIQQSNGEINVTHNIIAENVVGFNITGGKSNINFNEIYSNSRFGLIYSTDSIDYSNNWWGSNNPSYNCSLTIPEVYLDVLQISDASSGRDSWIVLNITKHDLDYHYWVGGVTYYNLTIDLNHNNLGEDLSNLGSLQSNNFIFLFNNVSFEVFIENGFRNYLFSWGYLTNDVAEMQIQFANQTLLIPLQIDLISPNIIYITPSIVFDDELKVVIECDDSDAVIFYTLDGTNPCYSSSRLIYTEPFSISKTNTIHATAIDFIGNYARFKYNYIDVNFETWGSGVRYYDFSITYFKKSDLSNSTGIWNKYNDNNSISNQIGPLNNSSKWFIDDFVSSGSPVIDSEGHIYIGCDDGYLYCLNSQGLVIWRYGTYSKISSTPTIGEDGNIYFANYWNSTVYCLSPNGKLLWKYFLGDYNVDSSPVFGLDGTLYVLTNNDTNSNLFAFKNHNLMWNCSLPIITGSTPAINNDGTIYLLTSTHYFIAINWDGSIKYSFSLINRQHATEGEWGSSVIDYYQTHVSVTVDTDGTMYVINQPHYYYVHTNNDYGTYSFIRAYNSSGELKWFYHWLETEWWNNLTKYYTKTKDICYGAPTLYKNVLYINEQSNLIAVSAVNGTVLWETPLNYAPYSASSPLISANEIIYLSHGNIVYALNLTGGILWSYSIPGLYGGALSLSSPVLTDDGTLIVTTNQGIYAFNDIAAEFTYSHVNGTERTIQFTDLSTKGNNSYFWSFGDGYYSQEQNPQHMYAEPGKYRVELVVEHEGINLARNTTIEVISYDITPPVPVTAYIDNAKTKGGIFNQTQIVTLVSSDESGKCTIYYTVDGSNPVNSSTRRTYLEPISVEIYTVLNAVAVDASNNYAKVSTFTFNITDAINVNDKINSTLIQKIQELLDNAEPNSKFVFDYEELYGANFTINKPLNIITNVNTRLVGNNNQPVFTFTENASNSTLNGFIIENDGADGILISNTDSVKVLNSIVSATDACGINIANSKNTLIKDTSVDNSTNGVKVTNSISTDLERITVKNSDDNGVWILNSKNTVLTDSLLENNGEDPYTSSANQILCDGSTNTRITNNVINYGVFGIHLKNTNENVLIDNNTVYEGIGDAIYLTGRYLNLNITHNTLDGCFNGINFNGYSENVEVVNNLIQKMHQHDGEPQSGREYDAFYGFRHSTDLYGQYNNAIQVFELASNFHNEVHIENNICILLEHRAWEARKTSTHIESDCDGYGYNLMDGSDSYHWRANGGATHYREGFVDLVLDRIGDSSYRLRLINQRTGEYLSDIPAFDVIFTAGRYTQTVKFINDSAIATFDVASSITTITAKISAEIKKSISWNIPISEGYSSSNRDKDPGYEAGEAINNPNPKAPSIADMIKRFSKNENSNQGNGNGHGHGQGTGTGNGQGSGNGHGSSGHGGSNVNGREGDVRGDALNQVKTDTGNSPSIGVEAAAEGDSDSVEGGSEDNGETTLDSTTAYEIKKVINIKDNSLQFVLAVLFSVIILIGFAYRKRKDGGEM